MGRYYISQKVNPGSVANPANFQTLFFSQNMRQTHPYCWLFFQGSKIWQFLMFFIAMGTNSLHKIPSFFKFGAVETAPIGRGVRVPQAEESKSNWQRSPSLTGRGVRDPLAKESNQQRSPSCQTSFNICYFQVIMLIFFRIILLFPEKKIAAFLRSICTSFDCRFL